jgi:hypothetical protein
MRNEFLLTISRNYFRVYVLSIPTGAPHGQGTTSLCPAGHFSSLPHHDVWKILVIRPLTFTICGKIWKKTLRSER